MSEKPGSSKLEQVDAPAFWRGLLGLVTLYCQAEAAHLIGTEGPVQD